MEYNLLSHEGLDEANTSTTIWAKRMPQPCPVGIRRVEDHPVFRQGLSTVIETEPDMVPVGQAANGVEAKAWERPEIFVAELRAGFQSLR